MKLMKDGDRNILNSPAASRVVKASQRLPFHQLPPPVVMQPVRRWQQQ